MAQDIKDTVLAAISTIVDNSVSALKVDKTITASVISCNNAVTGEYILSYNGGRITAYTEDASKSYVKNQSVYVLVPSGEISNRKVILGVAQNIGTDENLTSTAAALDNYNLLGMSLLTAPDATFYPKGVNSYNKTDVNILYEHSRTEGSNDAYMAYQSQNAQKNLSRAEKLLIQASFRTNLKEDHKYNTKGTYGFIVGVAFKDNQNTEVKYDAELASSGSSVFTDACETLKTELTKITYAGYTAANEYYTAVRNTYHNFWITIAGLSEESKKELQSETIGFPEYTNKLETTVDVLQACVTAALKQKVEGTMIKYYDLPSTSMIGDPYSYTGFSQQYEIFDIDTENFLYIDSAYLYCTDFEENSVSGKTDDIFIKDIKVYFLKEISSKNGDFSLNISQPNGNTFNTTSESETLSALCKVKYQNSDITSECEYFWFKKDQTITQNSSDYNYHGGVGWKYMGNTNNLKTYVTNASVNRAAENTWKVTVVYNNSTSLSDTIIFYNATVDTKITIESDIGEEFYFDKGTPTLTCKINGQEAAAGEYKYIWSQIDSVNGSTIFNATYNEYQDQIDKLAKNKTNTYLSDKRSLLTEQDKVKYITFLEDNTDVNTNKIKYDVANITSGSLALGCTVMAPTGKGEDDYYEVGSASIVLSNQKGDVAKDYYIVIANGAQSFEYTEAGVSPASNSKGEDQIEPQSLSCTFYDPNGYEISSVAYDLYWLFPSTSTLLVAPSDVTTSNLTDLDSQYYKYEMETCPISIAEKYDFDCTNNQVKAVITYDGKTYEQYTDFSFLKVGENGSNGTDIVIRITPASTNGNIDPVSKGEELLALITDSKVISNGGNSSLGGGKDSTDSIYSYQNTRWNTDESLDTYKLQANAYQNGQLIDSNSSNSNNNSSSIDSIAWDIAGQGKNTPFAVLGDTVGKTARVSAFGYYNAENDTKSNTIDYSGSSMIARATFSITKTTQDNTDSSDNTETTAYSNPNAATDDTDAASATTDKSTQSYYGFYPIPYINYFKYYTDKDTNVAAANRASDKDTIVSPIRVAIDKQTTLRSILYDSTGQNPQYNINQGIGLKIYKNENSSKTIDFNQLQIKISCVGGANNNNNKITESARQTAAFGVYDTNTEARIDGGQVIEIKDTTNYQKTVNGVSYLDIMKYIVPNDIYNGEYVNNCVVAEILNDSILLCRVVVPIHLSLNTHSLASLNAWDGNTIDISEDDGYILAPQIGAGYKETLTATDGTDNVTNVFTGVVMGTQVTYDEDNNKKTQAGLFGYSHGKQSININAEDGSATFGLNEDAASEQNKWNEGRISLVPGGESYIANWHIGSRALYNVSHLTDATKGKPALSEDVPNEMQIRYNMTDAEYDRVIDPRDKGILLSADPAWISVKGAPLIETTRSDKPINFDHGNTQVKPGDSLEIAIDPNQKSIFTLYQHSTSFSSPDIAADTPEITVFGNYDVVYTSDENNATLSSLGAHISYTQNGNAPSYQTISDYINKDISDKIKELTADSRENYRLIVGVIHKKNATTDENGCYKQSDIYTIVFGLYNMHSDGLDSNTNLNADNIESYTFTANEEEDKYSLDNLLYVFVNSTTSTSNATSRVASKNYYIATMRVLKAAGVSQRVDSTNKTLRLVRSENTTVDDDFRDSGKIFDEHNFIIRECKVSNGDTSPKTQLELDYNDQMVWTKTPRVGIDANGRFYTNALKDQSTALNMGKITAFDHPIATDARYMGTSFEVGKNQTTDSYSYLKVMVPKADNNQDETYLEPDNPVIISSGSTKKQENEYDRPMEMYAKDFKLYVDNGIAAYEKKRYSEVGLTLEKTNAHFGLNFTNHKENTNYYETSTSSDVKNYDRIYRGLKNDGSTINGTNLSEKGAFFDLFVDKKTTINPEDVVDGTIPIIEPNGYTVIGSQLNTEESKKITYTKNSGLVLTDSPFKLWNFAQGTGVYTKDFFQYVGADKSESATAEGTKNWNETYDSIWTNFGGKAQTRGVGEYYTLADKDIHTWTAGNYDLRAYNESQPNISLSYYKHVIKDNQATFTMTNGLLIGKPNTIGISYSGDTPSSGNTYLLGSYVDHGQRIDSDGHLNNEGSFLELRDQLNSYLYANKGFTLHAGGENNAGEFNKTAHTGDAGVEYDSFLTEGNATSNGIHLVSHMGGILLESRSKNTSANGNVSLWLRDPESGATTKSWMLGDTHHGITITGQGAYEEDGKKVSPRSRVIGRKLAVFSESSDNDYCVSIEPGLTSLFGYFNGDLNYSSIQNTTFNSNALKEIYSDTTKDKEGNKTKKTQNISISDFGVYAANGFASDGRICSTGDILTKGALYADTVKADTVKVDTVDADIVNATSKIYSKGHIVANDYVQADTFIKSYGDASAKSFSWNEDQSIGYGTTENKGYTGTEVRQAISDAFDRANTAKAVADTAKATADTAKTTADAAMRESNLKLSVKDFNDLKNCIRTAGEYLQSAGSESEWESAKLNIQLAGTNLINAANTNLPS